MTYIFAAIAVVELLYIFCLIIALKPVGTLRIDNSDPDEPPYLFLELKKESNPNNFKNKKYVTFDVNAKNYISHE